MGEALLEIFAERADEVIARTRGSSVDGVVACELEQHRQHGVDQCGITSDRVAVHCVAQLQRSLLELREGEIDR